MTGIISGDPGLLWGYWKPTFPMRPRSHESQNTDLYPLAYGLRVPVTLVALSEMSGWTVEHSLPAGKLMISHRMSSLGDGRIEVGKRFEVSGPVTLAYRLLLIPRIRRDWPRQLEELQRHAAPPETA